MSRHTKFHVLLLFSLIFICLAQRCIAKLPEAPPPRNRQEVEKVLAKVSKTQSDDDLKPLHILLVADKKDHGPCEHDYPLWQKRWQILLSGEETGQVNLYGPPQNNPGSDNRRGPVTVTTAQTWPNKQQFAMADVVVVFCYIQWNEQKQKQLHNYLNRGGGFIFVHSATWAKPRPSASVAKLIGCGGFTQYRHGPIKLRIADPNHPICFGLPEQIELLDESYWPPTPIIEGNMMRILATSIEKTGKNSFEMQPQPMFWTYKYSKGRVFGCVLGHYTWTFDDPYFRLLLLRGIAWSAHQPPYRLDKLATRGILLKD